MRIILPSAREEISSIWQHKAATSQAEADAKRVRSPVAKSQFFSGLLHHIADEKF